MANPGTLPAKMTAIAISEPGGPMVLKPEKRDLPELREGEILIRVRAAGVNRPDVLQRMGAYPPPPGASDLPGLEVAGEVAALGPNVKRWRIGDAVCALTPGGGYAEYCRVHETNALPPPAGYTFTEAGALPETFFTVWHNVFERGALKKGETLLVHGGSSGIGTTAIQLASAFGAYVVTTAGSEEKCAACLKLGADRAINYRSEDFVALTKDATGRARRRCHPRHGRRRLCRAQLRGGGGRRPHRPDRHAGRRHRQRRFLQADGEASRPYRLDARPRPVEFKAGIAAALEAKVWPLLAERRIQPVMDMIFPLREAWRAHERMQEGEHIGKIVLDVA